MNQNAYDSYVAAADASPAERGLFIRRTYTHLAGAVFAFAVLEALLLQMPFAVPLTKLMMGSNISWMVVLFVFMGITWVANSMAVARGNMASQYAGLALYVVAYAFLFVPLLTIVRLTGQSDIIPIAGMVTAGLFLGLTAVVMLSRVDFSFLGGIIAIGLLVGLGTIVASMIFGFSLGVFFSGAMALLAGGMILYQTSGVFKTYPTDQYVGASVALFGAVAMLFWYIIQLFMSRR